MWCIDSEKRSTTTTSRCGPSPNAFMFGFSCHPLLLLLLLSFRKVMCVVRKRILFARLVVVVVVGDDGGATWTGRSVQEEKRLAKKTDYHKKRAGEKMYTQTGYFAGRVHHRPCWRHSRKPKSFFFSFFPPCAGKKAFGLKGKKKNIFGCLVFFRNPPFFLSFFLSPRAASASWRVIYNRWKGPQHRGGKLLMSFSILPLSLSCCGGRQSYVNQSGNKPP